jgi:hypothetical protein
MSRIADPLRSLSCALVALALIVATAAWGFHNVRHGLDEIAAAAGPAGHQQAPAPDRQDGGHDHLQGFSFPVAALPDGTELAPPPMPDAAPPNVRVATLAFRPADPPLPDPPRTA